jgi:hypothetical protein
MTWRAGIFKFEHFILFELRGCNKPVSPDNYCEQDYRHLSRFEIAGGKRISRHLSNFLPELIENYFRAGDDDADVSGARN